MVPVEVRAFGLLAFCVILLALVLIFQIVPWRAPARAWPVLLLLLVLVVALAIVVLVSTRT